MFHVIDKLSREGLAAEIDLSRPLVLYGCGLYGGRILQFLDAEGVHFAACCDADPKKWDRLWKGLPVLSPTHIAPAYEGKAILVIAIASYNQTPLDKIRREVVEPLNKAGCDDILYCTALYQLFGRMDCVARGAVFKDGVIDVDGFKIPDFFADADTAIQSSFGQGMSEMLYQPDPEDAETYYDAPYNRNGPSSLKSDDVVIDCGANLGTFANYAASKGCRVWAFEPSPATAARMRRSAELYPGKITVHQIALSNFQGESFFHTSSSSAIADRIVANTEMDGMSAITVPTTTLDEFAVENGLARVDFIKSDIEGEERRMLEGATRILQNHAPRLSISSYHLPDDPEVLESLIVTANPKYRILHHKNKLYAWVD